MVLRSTAMKSQTVRQPAPIGYRPVDLARAHGISTQAVRNYEGDGLLPPAVRTPTGYRVYTGVHASALRAYLALVAAHGYPTGNEVMRAVHRGDVDAALRAIDASHAALLRDRETLDAVQAAVAALTEPPVTARPERPLLIGDLAHRIGVRAATLRAWERAGILVPGRDPVTRHRVYRAADVRDAELARMLRGGGYRLDHIATVTDQVRSAGDLDALSGSLAGWRRRLADRGRAMLEAAARLADHLRLLESAATSDHPHAPDPAPAVGAPDGPPDRAPVTG